ncbi:Spy/CpxP family protein refolding chaperone [Fuerstiella marisgermanici]|uniref:Uncharacterized protein n=1 Tax=Fuerstiella marisgermanici TaxID=1891926 RepID=A0A1P8WIS8_9PLAN|nr:Spy/CpxP family protein refolding chaperone [Fuerstiella marisgermanici]APZ93956.1 hypothetical protein Fuma_03574 [Fuerstiella marisgermanici]
MKTTSLLRISSTACLAAMLLTAVAEAQPGGGRGGRGGGFAISKAMLLASEDVLDELKVDETQATTIKAAVEAYQAERRESRPDRDAFEGKSAEERTAMFEKMRKEGEELAKKTDEMLTTLLEKEQVARLDQIALQVKMRFGLTRELKSDEMRKALSITDEQIAKIEDAEKASEEASSKLREEMGAMFRRGGGDGERPSREEMRKAGEEMNKKREALRKEGEAKVMALLKDDQKAKLKELTGEDFELDMQGLMRGGRGGFGGGRGGFGGGDRRGGGEGRRGGGDREGGGRRGGNRERPPADSDEAI